MLIYYPCDFCAFLSEESTGIDKSHQLGRDELRSVRDFGLTAAVPVGPLGPVGPPASPVGPAGPNQPVGPLDTPVGPPGAKTDRQLSGNCNFSTPTLSLVSQYRTFANTFAPSQTS